MTTYSTQNPLGSADPRDLYDNAENADRLINGTENNYPDRLGNARLSWAGIESRFADFLATSGYQFVGDYAAGIEITEYNQVVRDVSGEFWRLSGSTALPYTTTGAGLPEGGAFVAVGDAALRQELADGTAVVSSSTGSQTIAEALDRRGIRFTALRAPTSGTFDPEDYLETSTKIQLGAYCYTLGYYSPGDGGGNDYEIVTAGTGTDDGGEYIDLPGSSLQAKGAFPSGEVSLKQFGAVGDGVTDDSLAVASCVAYMKATGKSVRVDEGVFLTDPFSLDVNAYDLQSTFYGIRRDTCVLKRKSGGPSPFVQIGAETNTSFQANVGMRNLTIDGGPNTNGSAFVGWDLVRSNFYDVKFSGGNQACSLKGGISVTFWSCLFEKGNVGLSIGAFTSSAGGGWPNLIKVSGGEIVDNAQWGVIYSKGRVLTLDGVDIEGNGSLEGANHGGVSVETNVGLEVQANDDLNIGLIALNCWFEANTGLADISCNSGIMTVENCTFFSNSTENSHDIIVDGSRYSLRNCNASFTKTANVKEGASIGNGNLIENCDFGNLDLQGKNTTVIFGGSELRKGGQVPVVQGVDSPLLQEGVATTAAGSTISVTFPEPFSSIPKVFVTPNNGDSADILVPVISGISATGFSLRMLSMSSGSSAISSILAGCYWMAVGSGS